MAKNIFNYLKTKQLYLCVDQIAQTYQIILIHANTFSRKNVLNNLIIQICNKREFLELFAFCLCFLGV